MFDENSHTSKVPQLATFPAKSLPKIAIFGSLKADSDANLGRKGTLLWDKLQLFPWQPINHIAVDAEKTQWPHRLQPILFPSKATLA